MPETGGPPRRHRGPYEAHSARMYDYYLGGRTNYDVDQEAAEEVIASFPTTKPAARANRAFMHRATHFLAQECGIRQFVDIGTGIPTRPNLHEVAQDVAADSRVLYVDNDPIVLVYSEALLDSSIEGRISYIEADLTDPASILRSKEFGATIRPSQPVALSLNAVMHFVPDDLDAHGIVGQLLDALPSGSYLCLSHVTGDFAPDLVGPASDVYRKRGTALQLRTREEIGRFFDGLELVDPQLVPPHRWRPAIASGPSLVSDAQVSMYAGVALKP
jgi:hypothetical protein